MASVPLSEVPLAGRPGWPFLETIHAVFDAVSSVYPFTLCTRCPASKEIDVENASCTDSFYKTLNDSISAESSTGLVSDGETACNVRQASEICDPRAVSSSSIFSSLLWRGVVVIQRSDYSPPTRRTGETDLLAFPVRQASGQSSRGRHRGANPRPLNYGGRTPRHCCCYRCGDSESPVRETCYRLPETLAVASCGYSQATTLAVASCGYSQATTLAVASCGYSQATTLAVASCGYSQATTLAVASCGYSQATTLAVAPCGYSQATTLAVASCGYSQATTLAVASCGYSQATTLAVAPCGYSQATTLAVASCGYSQATTLAVASCGYSQATTLAVASCGYSQATTPRDCTNSEYLLQTGVMTRHTTGYARINDDKHQSGVDKVQMEHNFIKVCVSDNTAQYRMVADSWRCYVSTLQFVQELEVPFRRSRSDVVSAGRAPPQFAGTSTCTSRTSG
ncbi:hypothetical protein PR048_000014 [Dryococelus australis]|uniref:Uncharacterized protein n=1 Tax=Dryococelus australis TaxID=614101 RepID=A0ABQ9IDF1_9NEOP|nr:hypothetical protein PR048_000014 [Dryococelus australis]